MDGIIILVIGVGIAMMIASSGQQDSYINGRPRGGYRLGLVCEVFSHREAAYYFREILNKYAFVPPKYQYQLLLNKVSLQEKEREERGKNRRKIDMSYILLNNGEVRHEMRHYHKRIEINLYTGGRNTYDHSKLIIYPDIDGRVGIQIDCFNEYDAKAVWSIICAKEKDIHAINLTDKESENWLTEYNERYNLEKEIKQFPVFQYSNK